MAGTLHYARQGAGEPLVLLHGSGSYGAVWDPVLDILAAQRDVIVLDLPGHGQSPLLDNGNSVSPIGNARTVAAFLDDLGLETAHLAGNSSGAWTALELAKLGRARSVTALAPAGLWKRESPAFDAVTFRLSMAAAELARPVLPALASSALGRTLMLGQFVGRPWRMQPDEASGIVANLVTSTGIREHLEATRRERFQGGHGITVPVTVAWPERDWILLSFQSQHRDELPAHTRLLELRGCGHVPMYDDLLAVAQVLLEGSASSVSVL